MRLGLVPSWAKDPAIGPPLINARAETVAVKPSFKMAFQRRRCLVPADGFYEWIKAGRARLPVRFTLANGATFAFAGLWDRWQPSQGPELESFTIITTQANELVRPVHERMPVILSPKHYTLWLDPGVTQTQTLQDLLCPYPAHEMKSCRVSPRVNTPACDTPECIDPIPPNR